MRDQPNLYAGYVRVSSEEQKRHGLSPEYQEQKIKEYVNLKEGQLYRIYKDLGKSGGSIEGRQEFQEMLTEAKAGKFHNIVFLKLDRFGRSARDVLNTVYDLNQHKVKVVSIDGRIDTAGPYGKFQLVLIAGLAELERDLAKVRTEDIQLMKVEQGLPVNPPPFGYTRQRKKWVVNEKEAHIVRGVFTAAANGKRLPILCQKYGISRSSLYYMLRNSAYIGKITYKGKEYEGRHEPIISNELWGRVNANRAQHSKKHNRVAYSKTSYTHKW